MAIIDPNGLFGGDRIRQCSNTAQLHWPRLFLASDGFGRLEINYARIVGRAYGSFNPIPVKEELFVWINEYACNCLIFLYKAGRQWWGQWDTRSDLLPKFKTKLDKRSPIPPEPEFTEWKQRYRAENDPFRKSFGIVSEGFLVEAHGIGVGVGIGSGIGNGKNICASDARLSDSLDLSIDNPPFDTLEPHGLFPVPESLDPQRERREFRERQDQWFEQWWEIYWLKKSRKRAQESFDRRVQTKERFQEVMEATRAQSAEMLSREPQHRPHGATWLNGERWNDEAPADAVKAESMTERIVREIREERESRNDL
jgi:hypothetical protein